MFNFCLVNQHGRHEVSCKQAKLIRVKAFYGRHLDVFAVLISYLTSTDVH